MFPAAVDYVAPTSLPDALQALADAGEDGKVIAGGQSLIPLLRLRFAAPELLVDLRRIPGMRGVTTDGRNLVIGAATRHADILESPHATGEWSILRTTARQIADPQVRNLGTLGGSLAHADPEGDWATVMIALRADAEIASLRGTRTMPVRDFLQGMFTTDLGYDEILTSIRLAPSGGRFGGDYQKLSRRVGDFAAVGVAAVLGLREKGLVRKQVVIEQAGVALTALGPISSPVVEAEQLLIGQAPSDALFEKVADLVASGVHPHEDVRGSSDYKRSVVRTYTLRALQNALREAA